MNQFTAKYAQSIRCVLSGFDRLVLRGTIRRLSFAEGIYAYLLFRKVLLKDCGAHMQAVTERIKKASITPVEEAGRPVLYLPSSRTNKEEVARRIAREQQITEGPVCVLKCVEPCQTFEVYRNRDQKKLQVVGRVRQCTFLYHYLVHPTFGFMNARIQTWFPFTIQVCLNGREWLARQMAAEDISYARADNCFVRLDRPARAQELMDAQLNVNWPTLLDGIARTLNPLHDELFGSFCSGYYWSAHQSEWATDILFDAPQKLRRLYPMLVRHGMSSLASPDVMRFLGRKLGSEDRIPSAFPGEVTSDVKTRQEGVRIKHQLNRNSVKAYDKAYTDEAAVLRIETTMNNEADFKVYRPKEGDSDGPLAWRSLRRGVSDMYRRAQVCQSANNRYLDALASVDDSATLEELLAATAMRTTWNGKSVRALRPFEPDDARLLQAVGRGEFTLNGLRNRDLQRLLFESKDTLAPEEARRRSSQVTRMLRMLRAHGILAKVAGTHRYQVTSFGRQIITAVCAARQTPVRQLLAYAA
jgi:hypothetical protein